MTIEDVFDIGLRCASESGDKTLESMLNMLNEYKVKVMSREGMEEFIETLADAFAEEHEYRNAMMEIEESESTLLHMRVERNTN